MVKHSQSNLLDAIRQTIAYADVFDYPLTAPEIHRYLTGVQATPEEVQQALEQSHLIMRVGNYCVLPGRQEIVSIRQQRETLSRQLLPQAMEYGRVLGRLPYIRMVALTGSLAVLNVSDLIDFDYMLVAASGRVWTARAFALAFNRFTRLRGYTLCPNLILSENVLEWPRHDLYSARELCQMIPITGFDIYARLMDANPWVKEFLPNCSDEAHHPKREPGVGILLRSVLEYPLRGKVGDRLEVWEMNRKIARFSRQKGFGEETVFSADICQGNFDHHRSWTRQAFQQRLAKLDSEIRLPSENVSI
jgi:hypothetical protein